MLTLFLFYLLGETRHWVNSGCRVEKDIDLFGDDEVGPTQTITRDYFPLKDDVIGQHTVIQHM